MTCNYFGRLIIELNARYLGPILSKLFLRARFAVPKNPPRLFPAHARCGSIEIKEGATTKLRPGSVQVRSTRTFKAAIEGADGQIVGEVSSGVHRVALPPGKYTLKLDGQEIPVELSEGHNVEVKLP
jgi:hypothetical protein